MELRIEVAAWNDDFSKRADRAFSVSTSGDQNQADSKTILTWINANESILQMIRQVLAEVVQEEPTNE